MAFYISKMISATLIGRQTKHATCEKCQTRFRYELTRFGTGLGEAPFFLGQASAAASAQAEARRHLQERLEREVELVPCPKCGWVNVDVIKTYRKRKYRHLPWLSSVIVVAGFFAALFLGASLARVLGGRSDAPWIARLVLLVVCLSSPAWIFLLRSGLRRRINPNRTQPRWPAVPLGTPPALIERNDPNTGEVHLEPVPNRYEHSGLLATWAVYRLSQIELPPVCCICMAPASTTYRSPFKVGADSDFPVPLCGRCASRVRRRWWVLATVVTVAALALSVISALAIPSLDVLGRWLVFLPVSFLVVSVSVAVLPNKICRPYRFRNVDKDRGVFRFQAPNRAYTELLIDQVRQSNGEALD